MRLRKVRLVAAGPGGEKGTPGLVAVEEGNPWWLVLSRRPLWSPTPRRTDNGKITITPRSPDTPIGPPSTLTQVLLVRGDQPEMRRGESVEVLTIEDLSTPDVIPLRTTFPSHLQPNRVADVRTWLEEVGGINGLLTRVAYGGLPDVPAKVGRTGTGSERILTHSQPVPINGDRGELRVPARNQDVGTEIRWDERWVTTPFRAEGPERRQLNTGEVSLHRHNPHHGGVTEIVVTSEPGWEHETGATCFHTSPFRGGKKLAVWSRTKGDETNIVTTRLPEDEPWHGSARMRWILNETRHGSSLRMGRETRVVPPIFCQ